MPPLFTRIFIHACIHILALIIIVADGNAEPISVSAKVDNNKITIGDVITYTITVQHDEEIQVAEPKIELKEFDLIDQGIQQAANMDEFWYHLRADQTGTIALESPPIAFTSPDPKLPSAKINGQALAPQVVVEVQSVLNMQGEPKDIRDIKSIIPIARNWSEYYKYGFIALALILLAMLWKLKKKKIDPSAPLRGLEPHEQALQELGNLKSKQLLESGKTQEHYFELSEIFRRYLGARYGFPSLDWTSEEIEAKLRTQFDLTDLLQAQANSILRQSDKIKFAKVQVDDGTSAEIFNSAVQFIHATAKHPETINPPTR